MGNIPDDLLREFMIERRSQRPSFVPLIGFVLVPMLLCGATVTFMLDVERFGYFFVGAAALMLVLSFLSIGE